MQHNLFFQQPAPDGKLPCVLVTRTPKHYGRMWRHAFQLYQNGQPLENCCGFLWGLSPEEVERSLVNKVNYFKVIRAVYPPDWTSYQITWQSAANTGKEGLYGMD